MSHFPFHASSRSAFTLVEMLVAIGLFSIIVAIATGGFVNALRTERATSAIMAAESNVSDVLEQMARDMRTGYLFCNDINNNGQPTSICSNPGPTYSAYGISSPNRCSINESTNVWTCPNFIEYHNANGDTIDYFLNNQGVIERSDSAENGGTPEPVTGDNVSIKDLKFILYGNVEGDHWNPRITIVVGVQPDDPTINWTTANLQTSVSAREIDCTSGTNPSC